MTDHQRTVDEPQADLAPALAELEVINARHAEQVIVPHPIIIVEGDERKRS